MSQIWLHSDPILTSANIYAIVDVCEKSSDTSGKNAAD
jgi:hypothetical protein